jgi:peptide deformylase
MVRNILQIGDPVLNRKSSVVKDINDPKVKTLIRDLLDTCIAKENITAGLSAPQIGENMRVCVCRRMDLEEASEQPLPSEQIWEVLINPEILKLSAKQSTYWEGCLSVGEGPSGLWGPVTRPDSVDLEYTNIKNERVKLKCTGFFAHIVQHELDHLEGKLFLKYITDPELIWKSSDLDKYYEEHQEYPPV